MGNFLDQSGLKTLLTQLKAKMVSVPGFVRSDGNVKLTTASSYHNSFHIARITTTIQYTRFAVVLEILGRYGGGEVLVTFATTSTAAGLTTPVFKKKTWYDSLTVYTVRTSFDTHFTLDIYVSTREWDTLTVSVANITNTHKFELLTENVDLPDGAEEVAEET